MLFREKAKTPAVPPLPLSLHIYTPTVTQWASVDLCCKKAAHLNQPDTAVIIFYNLLIVRINSRTVKLNATRETFLTNLHCKSRIEKISQLKKLTLQLLNIQANLSKHNCILIPNTLPTYIKK